MKNTNNSVKKHQSYWVLFLVLLLSGPLSAKVNSYMGGYVQAGEWTLRPQGSSYGPSIGGVAGLGFLYELQAGRKYSHSRFLFDIGVGAQGGLTSFMQSSNQTATLSNQVDIQGDPFTYIYEVKGRRDQYVNVAAQLPLMLGFQHRKFYMLVGAKVYMNVWTLSMSSALLTTYGRYGTPDMPMFDDFHSMPEYQFFDNEPVKSSVPVQFNLDVDASIEIGGRLGFMSDAMGFDVPKRVNELRIAAFIDYGLFDIHKTMNMSAMGTIDPTTGQVVPLEGHLDYNKGVTAPVYGTKSMINSVVMSDIMSTSNFAKAVNNIVLGVKFTFLFKLPEEPKCVLCRDAYIRTAKSGGSGGVQYEE